MWRALVLMCSEIRCGFAYFRILCGNLWFLLVVVRSLKLPSPQNDPSVWCIKQHLQIKPFRTNNECSAFHRIGAMMPAPVVLDFSL